MSRLHIILADDDPDDCFILTQVLKEVIPKSDLTCLADCESLIKYLETLNPDQNRCKTPDLIFLDLNMPRMTGQDCLRKIRLHEICKNVPVIIYSTAGKDHIVEECYRIGANSFIVKPTEIEKLKDYIRAIVARFIYTRDEQ